MTRLRAMQMSAIAATATFFLTFAAVWSITRGQTHTNPPENPGQAAILPLKSVPPAAPSDNLRETNDVRVYRAVKDAVVNITSSHMISGRIRTGNAFIDSRPLDWFSPEDQKKLIGQAQTQSLGTGFVIHPAGYVITNEHVIEQGTDITCVFVNGDKFPASVIATDDEHDLAVLKITADPSKRFSALGLGTSEDLMIGEPVYAIGNPFGYAGTMTRGIISALDRTLDVSQDKSYKGLIQTDASINPGNSGGPLLNAYGQVIGINSAIRANAQGIGFAIAVSNMRDLLPDFLNPEVLNHAQIGFTVEEVRTREGPSSVGAAVIVKQVKPGSVAERAGIESGDKLVEINGNRVSNIVDALVPIASAMPDETLKLKFSRNNGSASHTILDASLVVVKQPPSAADDIMLAKMGIRGETITTPLVQRHQLRVPHGVYVNAVEPNSPAAKCGLQAGDVVMQLGRIRVNSTQDLATLLKLVNSPVAAFIAIVRDNETGQGTIALQ